MLVPHPPAGLSRQGKEGQSYGLALPRECIPPMFNPGIELLAFPWREAEGYGDGEAAGRHEGWLITAANWAGTIGIEGIGQAGPGDGLGGRTSGQRDGGEVVLIEEIVCSKPNLGLIEERVVADGVVDVGVEGAEGRNDGLVVIGTVVHTLLANAFVEDSQVEAMILIGEPLHLGIGRGLLNPESGGRLFIKGSSCRAHVQLTSVVGVGGGRIEVEVEAFAEDRSSLEFDALGDRAGLQEVYRLRGGGIDEAGVAVLEADAVGIGIDGDSVGFEDGPDLVGGGLLLLGRSQEAWVGIDRRGCV